LMVEVIGIARNLGDRISVMRIREDPDRMRVHKVSSDDLMKAVSPSSIVTRGDWLQEAKFKMFRSNEHELTFFGWPNSKPEQYENIILRATSNGEIIRLKDIGRIEPASTLFDISSDVDGQPAATIVLKRNPRFDGEMNEAVENKLKDIKTNGVFGGERCPPGIKCEVIPFENECMIYAVIETPLGSTREFTNANCHELAAIAKGVEGIDSVTSLAGYQHRTGRGSSNAGTCLIHLKDRSDRQLTSPQIIEQLEEKCRTMNVHFFGPPAFTAFFAAGGFSVRVLDRSNWNNDERPERISERFMDNVLNCEDLAGLFDFLAINFPQYELVIDHDVAKQKQVSVANAMTTLAEAVAGDAKLESKFRAFVDELSHSSAKNDCGEMVPYRSFLQLKNKLSMNEFDR
jgi:multidrug efflux pump subunit AcrB